MSFSDISIKRSLPNMIVIALGKPSNQYSKLTGASLPHPSQVCHFFSIQRYMEVPVSTAN